MLQIKRLFFVLVVSLAFFNMTCEEDDVVKVNCDNTVVVSENDFNNLESANFIIIDAEIEGDCLLLKIGASGCDGSTWQYNLVDSGAIAESLPEQRYLKFQLINEEMCEAYFNKTVSFNLSPLKIDNGVGKVVLHIEGLESSLTYTY
ncbi:hypothetical protein [Postechiella marina]